MPTRSCAALLGLSCLVAGCSSLQVDVDVYKGPLLHTPEVQLRQYAYLAISAKPMIRRMSDNVREALARCRDQRAPCKDKEALLGFEELLLEVLAMYEDPPASTTSAKAAVQFRLPSGQSVSGIDGLTRAVSEAFRLEASGDAEARKRAKADIRAATSVLNEALVQFAQRILFVVNNQNLFAELTGPESTSVKANKAVLQSLANTLIVHANDLSRQRLREEAMLQRKHPELRAQYGAFVMPPAEAFDRILAAARLAGPGTATPTAAPSPTPDPTGADRERLKKLEGLLDDAKAETDSARLTHAPLLAAMRTLRDPRAMLRARPEAEPAPSMTEVAAREADVRASAALYPAAAATDADRQLPGSLAPLREWLRQESAPTASSAERKDRLGLVLAHVDATASSLGANLDATPTKARVWSAILGRLASDFAVASAQVGALLDRETARAREIADLRSAIDLRAAAHRRSEEERLAKAAREVEGERIRKVLESVRTAVLKQAADARVQDAFGVHVLVRNALASLPAPTAGDLSADDLRLARDAVARSAPAQGPACELGAPSPGVGCTAKDQLDAIDELITGLRAQRVAALAQGNAQAAENLLAAINAAYDQRTAMIYLRPASDYLLSVHSASALQDGGEHQFRNMLNDWARYLDPRPEDPDVGRRLELEKLYWQNINRVTLGGGGFTNFVLAKDDVGNWYVKAYAADPKEIFKSAFNLALFNQGARLGTNLLERQRLLNEIEDTTDVAERGRLRQRLDGMNHQDGRPLLALRDRYGRQYGASTVGGGRTLQALLTRTAGEVDKAIEASLAGVAPDVLGTCKADDLKPLVAPLDATHLQPARSRLQPLLDQPKGADDAAIVVEFEGAIHAALLALHGYAIQVYRAIDSTASGACGHEVRRRVAERAREVPHGGMVTHARERRAVIERYEEALGNITDVAVAR